MLRKQVATIQQAAQDEFLAESRAADALRRAQEVFSSEQRQHRRFCEEISEKAVQAAKTQQEKAAALLSEREAETKLREAANDAPSMRRQCS